MFAKYFVYDLINGERVYDVSRVETAEYNNDIRFRLKGGNNEGLFLEITDFNTNNLLISKKMSNLYDLDTYTNTGVAWSSEQYKLKVFEDEYPDRIC